MTGSIQTKNGMLYGVITYTDEGGKKKHKWISTGLKERGNRKAAKEILDKAITDFQEQQEAARNKLRQRAQPKEADKADATMLFSDYCAKYIESIKGTLSAQVYAEYSGYYLRQFRQFFDKRKLRLIDITETELNEYYDHLRARGVKEISLKHHNNILRPALRKAYQAKLIPDNPFDFLEPIKKEKAPMSFYDKNEMKKLFEVIQGHKLEIPFLLASYYGFRRSEVLGLRWSAVDFDHKLISINHKLIVVGKEVIFTDELKTKTSNRTLPLIPAIEEALLKHRAQIEENKKFYGNSYDQRYLDYVCVEENGKIVYPDHMTKKFADLLKEHGLKHIRLHDLRHSCASNMLASGVPMKEIQEWLGHSNFSTTADVYSHLDFSAKIRAAQTISSVYDSGAKPVVATNPTPVGQEPMKVFMDAIKEMQALGIERIEDYLIYMETGKVAKKPAQM
ncbi:MAG: site-specific integrase [Clostridiales bacterium]|nr:site-specific integrase [Clostridiales bacterium]